MNTPKTKLIFGNMLKEGDRIIDDDYSVLYNDAESAEYCFTLTPSILSRHVLLLGGAGSGKTNVFNLTIRQLRERQNENDVFIFFDTKGDYYKHFRQDGDSVIGTGKSFENVSRRWNLFDEVLSDGENESYYSMNAREIAAALFDDRGSSTQPFFCNAARDIFARVIMYSIAKAKSDPGEYAGLLNNKTLVEFLQEDADILEYQRMASEYDFMKGILSYLGDGQNGQAQGVLSELKSMLSDYFLGVFCDDDLRDRFSMRDFVKRKGGKAVFIEYDLMTGETLTPIYKLLVDLALKEALGRNDDDKTNGNIYLILDELKLLPKLKHLDDALNFGRSKGVKVIAGIQSINQLYDIYGEEKGHVIAGGFSTLFAFHTSDSASRKYVSQLFGSNVVGYQYTGMDNSIEKREREGFAVEAWDQTALTIGTAVIGLADVESPFLFKFEEFKE